MDYMMPVPIPRKREWGGARANSGRKTNEERARLAAANDDQEPPRTRRRPNEPEVTPPAPPANPVPANKKPLIEIPEGVLERSRRPTRENPGGHPPAYFNPFEVRKELHPPRPEGQQMAMDSDQLAMDTAILANAQWAGISFNSAIAEGVTFMGYPFLSELLQRPEYRVMVEVIAKEATRKWIKLQAAETTTDKKGQEEGKEKPGAKDDKTAKIKELNDMLTHLRVRDAFRDISEMDSGFGRAHIYLDTGDTDKPQELLIGIGDGWDEYSKSKVNREKPLQRIKTIEPVWTYPTRYNATDPLKPDWYNPQQWMVQGKQMHQSRLLTFVGREVPDMLKPAYSFGGLALTQMAIPYVNNWLRTRQSVADLIHSFSVFALATNLQAQLQAGGEQLFRRAALFTNFRDNKGLVILDKDQEELTNQAVPLGTLDALQAQTQEHMAAVTQIPLVKLLGISPKGLNASSEGELRAFYDTIAAYQMKFFWEKLNRIIGFCMLSLWGEVDPDITFSFEPLWELDEKEKAEVDKLKAEAAGVLIDKGVLHPEEDRKRIAAAQDSEYADIEVDDVPEPPMDPMDPDANPDGSDTENQPEAAEDAQLALPLTIAMALDEWNESDHPRGQPENAGQFGPGGGGGGGGGGKEKPKGGSKPAGKGFSFRHEGKSLQVKAPNQETATRLFTAQVEQHNANKRRIAKGEKPFPLPTLETLEGGAAPAGRAPVYQLGESEHLAAMTAAGTSREEFEQAYNDFVASKPSKAEAFEVAQNYNEGWVPPGNATREDALKQIRGSWLRNARFQNKIAPSEPRKADASNLYKAPTQTADQLVASFPGGAEAIERTRQMLSISVPTDSLVSKGGFKQEDGTYTPERQAVHRQIVDSLFTPEAIAAARPAPGEKPVLTMLGGRGGSGKSWLTSDKGPVDGSKSLLIDCDHVKSMLPEYEGWNAATLHEESSDILALIDRRAVALGLNVIHDATLKSEATPALRMAQYEAAGYEVEGYYMYLSPDEAAHRAMNRYSKGGTFTGRFVPPEVILGNVNNEKNFDKLSGGMRKWAVYDNSTTETRQDPRQVSRSW